MNAASRLLLVLAFLLPLLAGDRARADWINLTGAETAPNIAEIHIEDDRVRLLLEVFVGDLATFRDLIPDDLLGDLKVSRPPLPERLRRFASESFQFITDTGEHLPAELKLAEPRLRKDRYSPLAGQINPYTRRRIPEPPADKRVLYAEIEYPFRQRPESLTIIPPLGDLAAVPAAPAPERAGVADRPLGRCPALRADRGSLDRPARAHGPARPVTKRRPPAQADENKCEGPAAGLLADVQRAFDFRAEVTWQVRAAAGQWGHMHEWRNEYDQRSQSWFIFPLELATIAATECHS